MYRDRSVALVIPCHNERRLIVPTLEAVPELFDAVYVVDDASTDGMAEVVRERAREDDRIQLLSHERNHGPGQAIITGYLQAVKDRHDLAVVVGGDAQMPLDEVDRLLDPLIDGRADYTKGNRFLQGQLDDTLRKMPKSRLIGNWTIAALTKVASGCYKVYDAVDGFTGITREAIERVDWSRAWGGYGYPMDFLVRMNAYGLRVLDVPRTAIYLPGERQSQIKSFRYALRVTPMLLKSFLWRLQFKYLYRDFHPLVLFYFFGLLGLFSGLLVGTNIVLKRLFAGPEAISGPTAILCALLLISGLQLTLFAVFFDMQAENEPKRD